jgi:hypothetical protein
MIFYVFIVIFGGFVFMIFLAIFVIFVHDARRGPEITSCMKVFDWHCFYVVFFKFGSYSRFSFCVEFFMESILWSFGRINAQCAKLYHYNSQNKRSKSKFASLEF